MDALPAYNVSRRNKSKLRLYRNPTDLGDAAPVTLPNPRNMPDESMQRASTLPVTKSESPSASIYSDIQYFDSGDDSKLKKQAKQKKNKLLRFTKKAGKFASDIAFGSAMEDDTGHITHPFIPHVGGHGFKSSKPTLKPQLEEEYQKKLHNIRSQTESHGMMYYHDYLRFFLKYMDESEPNDPCNYAITRNSLWWDWLQSYLKEVLRTLQTRQRAIDAKKLEDGNSETTATIESPDRNLKRSQTSSSSLSSSSHQVEIEELRKKLKSLPTIEEIEAEIFQDRRIVLLLLWHNQILDKLSLRTSTLSKILKRYPKDSEICVITTNKLKSFRASPKAKLRKLFKNHILPAYLELIDGWNIRHDFPDYRTNMVSLTDRFQSILDLKSTGYLPEKLVGENPHFCDYSFLSEEFVNSKMDKRERTFLSKYSSFTAPSMERLPLKDESQSLIFAPDFSRLVLTKSDVDAGLIEFDRVLKPGGSISLIMFDSLSYTHTPNVDNEVTLAQYIQIYINQCITKLSKLPKISEYILSSLQSHNFKNVKFVKLGIPAIGTFTDDFDKEKLDNSRITGQKQPSNSMKNRPHVLSSTSTLKPAGTSVSTNSTDLFDYHENYDPARVEDTLPNISDQPIASVYSMYSSFIEFLRVSQLVDLHSWMNDPVEGKVRSSTMNGVAAVSDITATILEMWLDWKLNNFNGQFVKEIIVERLIDSVDKDGYDGELGVRILDTDGNFWCNPQNGEVSAWYDSHHGEFNDGFVLGLDSVFLVTAEKL